MAVTGKDLIKVMEEWAPRSLAVDKDRIGLQVGDPQAEVKGVMLALDVTEEVVDEAIEKGANWIVAHHAVIFRPLTDLRTDRPAGRLYRKILKHDLQVYVAHTNLDAAPDGVNDVLCDQLGLKERQVLLPTRSSRLQKLVVFIPKDHHEEVLRGLARAGAGWIGNYSHCTFNLDGTGTFLPEDGTQPYIGKQGELARVGEVRLETVITEEIREDVLEALFAVHPYEEPAYDLYPLDLPGAVEGIGRIGKLPQPMSLKELAHQLTKAYRISGLRMVGDGEGLVSTVAVLGGSGGRYYPEAIKGGADVYITGDLDHHTALDAAAEGLSLLDPGHHVEHLVLEKVREKLTKSTSLTGVPVFVTQVNTDPFQYIVG
ncbi:MAG: Nif3-like dinuclear metal center hexameric protein [Firmicutes bacterium]|uniref:GTP cyclohydrolase 1 type 2 homolog n=1 Tax=Melghirimyces thermohalophilus TaxID=1236220 RepID=A0A1G6P667_9BACL|nr:Nif3-like dinuclear metal center hexameric protein [Melghirimyces thermohalophilus]MDA8352610.1 Nif3-like dinuclear metal center hexameric protein [Bacillota bacterium]SDC74986.1 dinuclear metal center protein, YbgI/SA1388 family [Melghirimyces thermohalophilus]